MVLVVIGLIRRLSYLILLWSDDCWFDMWKKCSKWCEAQASTYFKFDIRCSPFRNLRFDWRMIKIQSLNFNAFIYGRKGMEMEAGFRCCGWCCSALLYLDWTHIKHNLGVQGCSGYRMSITWSLKSIIHLYKTTLQRDDFPRCSTGSHPISNKGIKRITCALFLQVDGKRDSHFEGLPPSRTSGYARPPWKSVSYRQGGISVQTWTSISLYTVSSPRTLL